MRTASYRKYPHLEGSWEIGYEFGTCRRLPVLQPFIRVHEPTLYLLHSEPHGTTDLCRVLVQKVLAVRTSFYNPSH